jgi:malonyl-CoA O-methyltransferase
MSDPFKIDKRDVRRSFDRAAQTYDAAAALQQEVARRMVERLSLVRLSPRAILDAGSGTGFAATALSRMYPRTDIVELDLAHAMLRHSRSNLPGWRRFFPFAKRRRHLCADNEALPLRSESIDLVWSNLSYQWSPDLGAVLREAQRALRPEGLLMFSTFGPDTLRELREAFSAADPDVHVNRFTDMHDIGDLLVRSGFADPVMDMEYFTLTYVQVRDLMRELKSIGAHNVNLGRRRGLTGRKAWAAALAHYERLRDSRGRLPATFEVVYGHAWKPARRTGPGGHRVIDLQVAGRG